MYIIIIIALIFFILTLYTCLCIKTPYDRQIDDLEQTKFLKEYMEKKNKGH